MTRKMPSEPPDVVRARHLWRLTKSIRFSGIPLLDAKERVSLLTVAARIRLMGLLLDFEATHPRSIRDVLIDTGFFTLVARKPRLRPMFSRDRCNPKVVRVFEEQLCKGDNGKSLWFFNDESDRRRIKGSVDANPGLLLGYPSCCIERDQCSKKEREDAFVAAILRAVGENPSAIRQALVKNLKVEVEVGSNDNIALTEERYPFVLHVACDACLQDDASPSGQLNFRHSALVNDVDPAFHSVLGRMATVAAKMRFDSTPEEIDRLREEERRIYEEWAT